MQELSLLLEQITFASFWEVLVSLTLLGWFVLTVVVQLRTDFVRRIRAWDNFHVLPSWTFFSPNPGTKDYEILVRSGTHAEQMSDWDVVARTKCNKWFAFAWNTNKVRKKSIIDLSQIIIQTRTTYQHEERLLMLSAPYLILLNFSLSAPRSPSDRFVEFVVYAKNGFFEKNSFGIVIKSESHAIEAAQ